VAAVVFGDVSPAGRSPVTWYKDDAAIGNADQNGDSGNMDMYTNNLTYRFMSTARAKADVAIPFGFGLSFTNFSLSGVAAAVGGHGGRGGAARRLPVKPCDTVELTAELRNVGARDSDEVVQVYVQRLSPSSTPAPFIRLVNFTRLHVKAAASVAVALNVGPRARAVVLEEAGDFWHPRQVLERGPLRFWVGGRQPNAQDLAAAASGAPLAMALGYVDVDVTEAADLDSCSGE
jgi:beta-glucosidase